MAYPHAVTTQPMNPVMLNSTLLHPNSGVEAQPPAEGNFNHSSVRHSRAWVSLSRNADKAWTGCKSGTKKAGSFIVNVLKDVYTFVSTVALKTAAFASAGTIGGLVVGGVFGLVVAPGTVIATAPSGALIGFGASTAAGVIYGCHKGWKAVKKRRASAIAAQELQDRQQKMAEEQVETKQRLERLEMENTKLQNVVNNAVTENPKLAELVKV